MAIEIFKLFGSIMVDNKDANKQLDQTDKKAKGVGSSFASSVGKAVKFGAGVAAAAGTATTALFGTATAAADSLDAIQKGAQKLGLSYENYQLLSYAADRSGASIDNLSKGMKNITKDLGELMQGNEDAAEAYDALGVSVYDAEGNLRSAEDVMLDSIYALADLTDETERNTKAQEIFGNGYTELIPLLNSGSDGIKDMMNNCKDLGLVMSDDAVDAGAAFGDQLADVKDSLTAVKTNIGEELLPMFRDLLSWIQENMPAIKETIKKVAQVVSRAIETIRPLAVFAFEKIGGAVQAALDVFDGFFTFLDGLLNGDWEKVWDGLAKIAITAIRSVLNPLVRLHKMVMDIMGESNAVVQEDSRLEDIATYGEDYYRMVREQFTPEEYIAMYGQEAWDEVLAHTPGQAFGGQTIRSGLSIVGEAGPELLSMPRGAVVTPLNDNNNAFVDTNKKLDRLIGVVSNVLDLMGNMGIYLDGDQLVGGIAPKMDATLGQFAVERG